MALALHGSRRTRCLGGHPRCGGSAGSAGQRGWTPGGLGTRAADDWDIVRRLVSWSLQMQNDSLLAHAGQCSAVAASLPGDLNLRVEVVPSPSYVGLTAITRPSFVSLSREFVLKENTGFAVVLLACGIGVFARVLLVRRRFQATAPGPMRARQQMMTTGVTQVVEVESGSSLAALTSKSSTDGPKDGAPVGCAEGRELPGESVGESVGRAVGAAVGSAVGLCVGLKVGAVDGEDEGGTVGPTDGDLVGPDVVGEVVGMLVVGAVVGEAVGIEVCRRTPHPVPCLLLPCPSAITVTV